MHVCRASMWLVLAALCLITARASAGSLVTVDFEATPHGLNPENYFEDGFRVSPNCHYDNPLVLAVDGVTMTRALAWDSAGCFASGPNFSIDTAASPEGTR